jgi:hypothetical protein
LALIYELRSPKSKLTEAPIRQTANQTQSRHFRRKKLGRTLKKLKHEINTYARELEIFTRHKISRQLFNEPDHVAYKAFNTPGFEQFLGQVRAEELEEDIVIAEMDGRRIATAFLAGSLALGSFGEVTVLEIMEPKPEKVGQNRAGLDHVEFYYPDFGNLQKILTRGQVNFSRTSINSSHNFIGVRFGEESHELKFTDKRLADIVKQKNEVRHTTNG